MGAAASLVGETAQEFEDFKKIRDEYEVIEEDFDFISIKLQ